MRSILCCQLLPPVGVFSFYRIAVITEEKVKLVFVGVHPRLAVIANQCAHWCGNPPVEWNQVTITTKNRKVFPLCGAIVDTFSL